MKKACLKCKILTEENACPKCGSSDLSESWRGRLIVIDEKSEIAQKLKLGKGEFAIKTK